MYNRFLLIVLAILWLSSASARVADTPAELRDLYYGEALFQLYQKNYFTAIVHLLAARQQGHMGAYDEEPELLLGGLYLAYGMPDAAQQRFDTVLTEDVAPSIHDRAWLQLAKARYRLNQPSAAITAISHVGNTLPEDVADERWALEGLVDIRRADFQSALEALGKVSGQREWSHYADYNRAIALLQSGKTAAGLELLGIIGSSDIDKPPAKGILATITSFWGDEDATDESEMKALKDRANLVRGYLLLQADRPVEARAALEKIHVDGLDTSQALLGVGWAALQDEKPADALPPWQMLAARDARDQAVLEVLLAIPYALSTLGDDLQALDYYTQGIERYDAELARLDNAIDAIRQGALLAALRIRLDAATPRPSTTPAATEAADRLLSLLPLLLSEHKFQNTLQDYRDILYLDANLADWQEKIGDYQTMLTVRQAAYERTQPIVEEKLKGAELASLQAARNQLKARLDRARAADEPLFGLASSGEKALLARLDHIDELIARIGGRQDITEQAKTARLLRGIIIWTDVTDYPGRRWQAEQDLATLDQTLLGAAKQQKALRQAQHLSEGGFGNYATAIATLEGRLDGLDERTASLKQALIARMQSMAITTLQDRQRLINNYLVQARFGVATLLDRNSTQGGTSE